MKPVISVEHLTKRYELGVIGTGTLTRDLERWWARVRKQPDPYTRIGQKDAFEKIGESILALDEVSFTVEQGEALGIIGKNGAGKSTLLKILSRVTAPTSGVVKVKGRIGSLLEVGTGFHPELTGRENIYLNGAILGMKKAEVARKFDEIVDFSGVEKFIDTPVKRYSSGMYVRLAFAVAAHLDPEILVVDEVLAVGDAEFQKKCLGKMDDVANKEGRTVLFVSHNMAAVKDLCKNAILIFNGKILETGKTTEVIDTYLRMGETNQLTYTRTYLSEKQHSISINSATILINDDPSSLMKFGDSLSIQILYSSKDEISKPSIGFVISSNRGDVILNSNNIYLPSPQNRIPIHSGKIICNLGKVPLMEGRYFVSLWLGEDIHSPHQHMENTLSFEVIQNDIWGTGRFPTRNISHLWWPTQFEFLDLDG